MESTTVQLTQPKHKKFAYAITDRELRILTLNGAVNLFNCDQTSNPAESLLSLTPELNGHEQAFAEILAGERPALELSWVERKLAPGQRMYLNMVVKPYRDSKTGKITGLIYLIDDVTEWGAVEQNLIHERNALQLQQKRPAPRPINWPPKARRTKTGVIFRTIHRLLWFASGNAVHKPLPG